jgi:hypothetical protein
MVCAFALDLRPNYTIEKVFLEVVNTARLDNRHANPALSSGK